MRMKLAHAFLSGECWKDGADVCDRFLSCAARTYRFLSCAARE
jgi:hypothetical protein